MALIFPTVVPNDAVVGWLKANAASSEFAKSLYGRYQKYGNLSPKQNQVVEDNLKGNGPKQAVNVDGAGIKKVEVALYTAASNGLKRPKLRLGDFIFMLAPASGKNPGAIYVREAEDYMGKIVTGIFYPVKACDKDRQSYIASICADPLASAIAYGKMTGNCSCCGRPLSDPKSVALGIGPICKSKYGWGA